MVLICMRATYLNNNNNNNNRLCWRDAERNREAEAWQAKCCINCLKLRGKVTRERKQSPRDSETVIITEKKQADQAAGNRE